MYKRKKISARRLVTINELADDYGVHRHTMSKLVKEFGLDFYSWKSLVDFGVWMDSKQKKGS